MFKLLTKDFTKIPLFRIDFNLKKYEETGPKDTCTAHIHPSLKKDEHIEKTLRDLIDYIRDNYDMDELTK